MADELIRLLALGGSGGVGLGVTYIVVTSLRPIVQAWLDHRARLIEAREAASMPLAERLLVEARQREDRLHAELDAIRGELALVRARCAACHRQG
jgi:hypothetical protein